MDYKEGSRDMLHFTMTRATTDPTEKYRGGWIYLYGTKSFSFLLT